MPDRFVDNTGANAHVHLRTTRAKAGEPPECDVLCKARWGDRPHMHEKTEGLDDGSPFFVIAVYCSCGFLAEETHYDVSKPIASQMPESDSGPELLLHHFRTRHGFDPETDQDWQERASRAT